MVLRESLHKHASLNRDKASYFSSVDPDFSGSCNLDYCLRLQDIDNRVLLISNAYIDDVVFRGRNML